MRVMLILGTMLVIFTVFTTVFAASAPKNEVRSMPKWAWVILCLFVTPIGGILYLMLGRPGSVAGGANPKNRQTKTTLAPDDDPEFLRNLERRLRETDNPDGAGGQQ